MKKQLKIMIRCKGFTLIELMVTLVVASILIIVALPSFTSLMRDNEATSETNKLIRDLNFARSEAVQRGVPVSICRSSNGATCGGASWRTGWIVFTDSPFVNGGNRAVDGADILLQVNDGLTANFTIPAAPAVNNGVTFLPRGGASAAGSFVVTPPAGSGAGPRQVNINAAGRVSVTLNAVAPAPAPAPGP